MLQTRIRRSKSLTAHFSLAVIDVKRDKTSFIYLYLVSSVTYSAFAFIGPFLGAYYRLNDLTGTQIGVLNVITCLSSFLIQPLWAAGADRNDRRRLYELENEHQLYAKCVIVKKLRKGTLGRCSVYKQIWLSPLIVIFPQELMDGVILHEMAHLKHLNHRKPFWDFLSILIGTDAKEQKMIENMALSKYGELYVFLMK